MRFATTLVAASALALAASDHAEAGAIFDAVKEKGFVQCGVSTGLAGFSNPDDAGNWSGLSNVLAVTMAATDDVPPDSTGYFLGAQ